VIDLVPEHAREIEQRARALGWIRVDERAGRMAPAGAGNMNRTLRVPLGGRSIVLKQSVPFVAKYPQIAAPAERITVEASFYRAIAGTAAVMARMPRVLGFDEANRLLCMEDLGAGADFTDLEPRDARAEPCAHLRAAVCCDATTRPRRHHDWFS
jgi:5-methylthioribose kinase